MTFGVRRASLSISETANLLILQQHSDGSVRICCKQHKNMTPSRLVSTVQAGGGGVGDIWPMPQSSNYLKLVT